MQLAQKNLYLQFLLHKELMCKTYGKSKYDIPFLESGGQIAISNLIESHVAVDFL